jgi:tetratricopeptide (TPR) repeat protein
MQTPTGMMEPRSRHNPFPGLRPYEPDEDHLFFGREKEIDALLRRLSAVRFLPVIGTSGCGKSSLVRCGLIPALESGYMVRAGSSWRVALTRPGEDPVTQLAMALDDPSVLGRADDLGTTNRVILDATLRRSSLGLISAVREAHLPPHDNVLVVIDQFEELFRYRTSQSTRSRDAVAFVNLLLEAVRQQQVPIYIVLTMRSDFLGDCMEYPGLPEAINDSQYLVPRMTRDEMRSAITGPISVAGGTITPRLVVRLLNELGDSQDNLPLLQHVLMRMWDHAYGDGTPNRAIDLDDYTAVGTLRDAMSLHADEACAEAEAAAGPIAVERIFKALTDTYSDPRGVRRPTTVADLAAIGRLSEKDVIRVVEIFRQQGRSFLTPPPTVPLGHGSVIDLSHESLMRGWRRLIQWAQEERAAAALYFRLSREATWWAEGAASLWSDPELELGLRWRRENEPTVAWGQRYDDNFDRAIRFLDLSEAERERQKAERRAIRVRNLQIAWGSAAILLVAFVVAVGQWFVARREYRRADANLGLATSAVDQLLLSVDRDPGAIGADVPQMEELRRELLERARPFYGEFITQQPNNEALLRQMAFGHFRLGHIDRMLDDSDGAAREYQEAIAQFARLAQDFPAERAYREALANSYNWLGETHRLAGGKDADAEQAYNRALDLQEKLAGAAPDTQAYQQELARTRYNRGILYANGTDAQGPQRADQDFREAIRILDAVNRRVSSAQARQDLSRAHNNLAVLRARDSNGFTDARANYERAIALHRSLVADFPDNREYKSELVQFLNNYSDLLRELGEYEPARDVNAQALALMDDLVRPAPTLGIEQADTFNLRGRILQAEGSPDAIGQYRRALDLFRDLEKGAAERRGAFHLRFGDLLSNSASLAGTPLDNTDAQRLLDDEISYYADLGIRLSRDRPATARDILATLRQTIDSLPAVRRGRWQQAIQALENAVTVPAAARR